MRTQGALGSHNEEEKDATETDHQEGGAAPGRDAPGRDAPAQLSSTLTELKERQDKLFAESSPAAKACFGAIVELERYDALTGKGGLMEVAKDEIAGTVRQLKFAVKQAEDMDESLKATEHSDAVGEVAMALRGLAYLSQKTVKLMEKLASFEKEVKRLEPRIVDDANLPDFEAMNDQSKRVAVDELARDAVSAISGKPGGAGPDAPAGDEFDKCTAALAEQLKPIKWNVRVEWDDTAIAPTKLSAQGIMVMRIKQKLARKDVKAWRDDAWKVPPSGSA